jgi:hypothetical protein
MISHCDACPLPADETCLALRPTCEAMAKDRNVRDLFLYLRAEAMRGMTWLEGDPPTPEQIQAGGGPCGGCPGDINP